jgi:hypothetical protein
MRRGICTGLGGAADRVIDCEVTDSVAAGFNIGSGDVLERCHADAKYAEALSCPYMGSRGAKVDLEILDSRGGAANDLLATLNGQLHQVWLHTPKSEFVPAGMVIAQGTRRGYAYYERGEAVARDIQLRNDTPAKLVDEASTAPPETPPPLDTSAVKGNDAPRIVDLQLHKSILSADVSLDGFVRAFFESPEGKRNRVPSGSW